jgi:hypothetical protein
LHADWGDILLNFSCPALGKTAIKWLVSLSALIAVTAFYHAGNTRATPANGFVMTTLAKGRFGETNVFNRVIPQDGPDGSIWVSWQKTTGLSDVYAQSNVWSPGGSTGWHTHAGHSLIIVTAGTGDGL